MSYPGLYHVEQGRHETAADDALEGLREIPYTYITGFQGVTSRFFHHGPALAAANRFIGLATEANNRRELVPPIEGFDVEISANGLVAVVVHRQLANPAE